VLQYLSERVTTHWQGGWAHFLLSGVAIFHSLLSNFRGSEQLGAFEADALQMRGARVAFVAPALRLVGAFKASALKLRLRQEIGSCTKTDCIQKANWWSCFQQGDLGINRVAKWLGSCVRIRLAKWWGSYVRKYYEAVQRTEFLEGDFGFSGARSSHRAALGAPV